jgi:exosortase
MDFEKDAVVSMNLRNKSTGTIGLPAVEATIGYARVGTFVLFCFLPLAVAWDSMRLIASLAIRNGTFSQAPLIPLVSVFLVYLDRKTIFSKTSPGWIPGTGLTSLALIFVVLAQLNVWKLGAINQCSLLIFGIALFWMGAFVLFFGTNALRAARFPLLFLIFAVPIPEPILSQVTFLLQKGSADVAEWFFRLGGIPYLRRDFVFALPGVTIRVADECSGIRSSLALLITATLAGHLFLRSTWRRLFVGAVVLPLAVLKNGLRIMTLSTLSIYVNPGFLYGNLHRRGGIVFFAIVLVPMALLLIWLQKSEAPRTERPAANN